MRVFPNGTGLLLGLLLTFFGAWEWPNGALWLNTFFSNSVSQFAVVLVFLIQGWNLNANRIPTLFKDYRNLVLVQGAIFVGPLFFVLFLHANNFFTNCMEGWLYFFVSFTYNHFKLCSLHLDVEWRFRPRTWTCHAIEFSRHIMGPPCLFNLDCYSKCWSFQRVVCSGEIHFASTIHVRIASLLCGMAWAKSLFRERRESIR